MDLVLGNTDDARVYLNNGTGFTAGIFSITLETACQASQPGTSTTTESRILR